MALYLALLASISISAIEPITLVISSIGASTIAFDFDDSTLAIRSYTSTNNSRWKSHKWISNLKLKRLN